MIVLLHGFAGTVASWDGVRAHLAASRASLEVRREALSGHAPGILSDTFSDEVDRLAARVPAGAHLAGYSLGGRLALALALRHPERVARLTLVSTRPGLPSPGEREARRADDERWARLAETDGLDGLARAWDAQPLLATRRALRPRREGLTAAGLAHALRTLGAGCMPDLAPQLPSLRVPVTLLAGALDPTYCALADAMAAALPRARRVIVAGAGHDLPLEAPRAVAAALEEEAP